MNIIKVGSVISNMLGQRQLGVKPNCSKGCDDFQLMIDATWNISTTRSTISLETIVVLYSNNKV